LGEKRNPTDADPEHSTRGPVRERDGPTGAHVNLTAIRGTRTWIRDHESKAKKNESGVRDGGMFADGTLDEKEGGGTTSDDLNHDTGEQGGNSPRIRARRKSARHHPRSKARDGGGESAMSSSVTLG